MSELRSNTDLSLTAGVNLYYDLHVPDGIELPSPLLIAVHGYGAHKRYMMREAKLVAPDGFVIASVQAPYQHFRQTADETSSILLLMTLGLGDMTSQPVPPTHRERRIR